MSAARRAAWRLALELVDKRFLHAEDGVTVEVGAVLGEDVRDPLSAKRSINALRSA